MNWIKANPEKSLLGVLLALCLGVLAFKAFTLAPETEGNTGPAGGAKPKLSVENFNALKASLTSSPEWQAPASAHKLFISRKVEWLPNVEKIMVYEGKTAGTDGVPREWKKKHGFPENVQFTDQVDTDQDGFSNIEEYNKGKDNYDPRDPKSHPDYLLKLRLAAFEPQPFYMLLKSYTEVGGKLQFQLVFRNVPVFDRKGRMTKPGGAVLLLASGDSVKAGTEETGWVVGEFRQNKGVRMSEKTKIQQEFDESQLDLSNKITGEKITLTFKKEGNAIQSKGTLVFLKDGSKIPISLGREFDFAPPLEAPRKFRVKTIGTNGVTLVSMTDGKTETVIPPENSVAPTTGVPAVTPAAAPATTGAAVHAPTPAVPPAVTGATVHAPTPAVPAPVPQPPPPLPKP